MLTQQMILTQPLDPQGARVGASAVQPSASATVFCQQKHAWASVLSSRAFGLIGRSWASCGTQAMSNLENVVFSFSTSGLQ